MNGEYTSEQGEGGKGSGVELCRTAALGKVNGQGGGSLQRGGRRARRKIRHLATVLLNFFLKTITSYIFPLIE